VLTAGPPAPGGSAARAGIREGDRFDLREQTLQARTALMGRVPAWPVTLMVHRGTAAFSTSITANTVREGVQFLDALPQLLILVASCGYLACALLIILRRAWARDGRVLALILISTSISGSFLVMSDPRMTLLLAIASNAIAWSMPALLIHLAAGYGTRRAWRRVLAWIAYALLGLAFLSVEAQFYGIFTLRVDPTAIYYSWWYGGIIVATLAAILAVAVAAVAGSPVSERPRAAWLLLPVPLAWLGGNLASWISAFTSDYITAMALTIFGMSIFAVSTLAVTYAVLNRRVLDLGFVLSRTLVVAIVSLIIVFAFVLLEWLLGSVLAGVSHATGVIANATLALLLGVSLRFIHKRADTFVDAVMFRKRHEDERALRDFSKEAAFVTARDALLDQTLAKIRDHTDARTAALFVRENGSYAAARQIGEAPAAVDDNDPAILALRTWHKPLDPHRYATALRGDLALPLIARGTLLGVLVCGERAGGEAYAPDEIETLSQFAHGVGSALEALGTDGSESSTSIQKSFAVVADAVAALGAKIDVLAEKIVTS
jgi:hypothetical protein